MKEDLLRNFAKQLDVPTYVFDTDLLIDHVKTLQKHLSGKALLCYAMKANPFLIEVLEPHLDYLEVCSPGELNICLAAKIPLEKIILSGVYKSTEDIESCVSRFGNVLTYTVESIQQWDVLNRAAINNGTSLRVLLRLSSGNQFGLDPNDLKALCNTQNSHLTVVGIHYFSGTQRRSPLKYERDIAMLEAFIQELPLEGREHLSVEYGPGLPVHYFVEDESTETVMVNALLDALSKQPTRHTYTVELGRYLVASCGHYITQVVDCKVNEQENYCIVDGGIHQVTYYGQNLAMKTPFITPVHQQEVHHLRKLWNVCGALCTTNDVLAKHIPFDNLQIGDHLIFNRVGAYAVTESLSLFLSRDLPQVMLYSERDGFRCIRAHQELHSLNTANQGDSL